MLYLSEFFEKEKRLYYDNLSLVREKNDLLQWLKYFLVGVDQTARRASDTLNKTLVLKENVETKLRQKAGRRTDSAMKLLSHLFMSPLVKVKNVEQICSLSKKSANILVNLMIELNILKEISGKSRNRFFMFKDYIKLFE